ncbi:DNA-binding transcriptional LysR family regulator [Paenibacillus mucilaginosus]|uniref:LysR family transcriptional regulator n=1 Tax=Paenibacillus mucilaginosus TaxID=61624 RepID=UPI003D22FDAD
MELYQLKTFLEIARRGSLTEAAARLNTSQPAASAHIKALEKEVGFSLFHRTSKGMALTEKGAELLQEARNIFDSVDHFYAKANLLKGDPGAPVRIGLNTHAQLLRVEDLIRLASESIAQAELHFIESKSEDFLENLGASRIHAGFYYGFGTHPSVYAIPVASFPMVVVYPKGWEVPETGLSLAYFAERPWIWTTPGCPFYRQSIDYFLQRDLVPGRIMYVDDESLIGDLVHSGIGCSLLAEPVAMRFVRDNKLRSWDGLDLQIDLHFGYLKEKRNDPVLREIGSIVDRMWNGEEGRSA